ncbi:MAG: ATP-dependent transcriptional regulator [Chlorobi bacterium]|nr:ATP-dependent transcriptional regulator [Chlorobiota bacterium]
MDWATNRNDSERRIPLLTTKFHVARTRSTLVSRSRLIEQLNHGLQCKLTIISAPAGCGKTTLLSEWANRSRQNVAWVSLDEGDSNTTNFWAYFIGSLQRLQRELGSGALDALYSGAQPEIALVLTALINDLAAIPQEIVLILDDYHIITDPAIHDTLTFFIERMPPQFHLFVAARIDPPLRLTRLRAHGEVNEIRSAEIRFTPHESLTLLEGVENSKAGPEELAAAVAHADGWAVGLQLAALAIAETKGKGGPRKLLTAIDGHGADYLADEVADRQPRHIREFLLRTAILERMCAPLCDAVTGETNGEEMLERLYADNLFILPLDEERQWFRYHPMFAKVLCERLQRTWPDEVRELHYRASRWFEEHDAPKEAVDHLLKSGDLRQAIDLAERLAERLLTTGNSEPLLSWTSIFPDAEVIARPRLAMAFAWALVLGGEFGRAEKYLEICRRFVEREPETGLADIAGHLATVRSFLDGVDLPGGPSDGDSNDERAVRFNNRAPGEEKPRTFAGGSSRRPAGEAVPVPDSTFSVPRALPQIARLQFTMGQLKTSAHTYREALRLLEQSEVNSESDGALAAAYIGLGELEYEWNDLDGTMRRLELGLDLAAERRDAAALRDGYLLMARVHQSRGDLDGALDAINEAERAVPSGNGGEPEPGSLMAHRARIWVAQGNLQEAAHWLQESGSHLPISPESFEDHLTVARTYIAQYRSDNAVELLGDILRTAEERRWNDMVIRLLVLLAIAFDQQGDTEQATAHIRRALTMAEPEGYVRTFIQDGAISTRLLQNVRAAMLEEQEEDAIDYIDSLLERLGAAARFIPQQESPQANGAANNRHMVNAMELLSPLSDREIEVLKLIANGKSNASIGDALYISLSTVKTHINNLYSKLGVESRTQALVRAKEINLL